MTKAELLADFASEFFRVGPAKKAANQKYEADFELTIYEAVVFTKTGDFIAPKTKPFYVYQDTGGDTDIAFKAGNESSIWMAKVEAFVKTKIDDLTIVSAYKLHIDPENKTAFYKVIFDNSGTYEERLYNIRQKPDDSWELKRIG